MGIGISPALTDKRFDSSLGTKPVRILPIINKTQATISSYETQVSTNFETECLRQSQQNTMSLEMPVLGSNKQKMKLETSENNKMDNFVGEQEEESNWETDFLQVIHGTPDQKDKNEAKHQFQVPVCEDFKPEGSLTVAIDDTWSQQHVSAPSSSVELFHDYYAPPSPASYQSVPLHLVEGKDDPEDEGICVVSPPPSQQDETSLLVLHPTAPTVTPVTSSISTNQDSPLLQELIVPSPILSMTENKPVFSVPSPVIVTSSVNKSPSAPESSPEKQFFEEHNIMKWVIDDQDRSDIPGLGISCPSSITSTAINVSSHSSASQVVSSSASTKPSQQYVMIKPKTELASFIEKFKVEDEDLDEKTYVPVKQTTPSPSKRKRGRPVDTTPREITQKLPRMRRKSTTTSESEFVYCSDSASGMTDDEVSALKYRRMRDLNNEASKRCRENRKSKLGNAEAELRNLYEKNLQLKETVAHYESMVARLKSKFLQRVQNPSQEIAFARRRQMSQSQSVIIKPEIIGSMMSSNSAKAPDVDTFWST